MSLPKRILVNGHFFMQALIVVVTLLAVAVYWQIATLQRSDPVPSVDVLESGGLILGDRNSPMELVIVFSPTCPYCQAFFRDQLAGLQERVKLRLYFKGEARWATALVCAYQADNLEESLLIMSQQGVESLPRCLPDEKVRMTTAQWINESNRVNNIPVPTFYWVEAGQLIHHETGYSPAQWRNIWAERNQQP